MHTIRDLAKLVAVLVILGEFGFLNTTASAQTGSRHVPNSYEDYPYNQGGLFYQYRGPKTSTRTARKAPRRNTVLPRRPAGGLQPITQPRPTYYYYGQPGTYGIR